MNPDKIALDEALLTPEFLSQEEETLFAEAMLGQEAITFLNSDLGRVLRGYALQQREEAKEELLKTAPWRKRKIASVQFKAAVANQFLQFVREAVMRGEIAHQNLINLREYS
ncbi:MAG: hypothetical protein WC997_15825 [Porticoccaceae bacterium]